MYTSVETDNTKKEEEIDAYMCVYMRAYTLMRVQSGVSAHAPHARTSTHLIEG